jgi:thiosulfate/3-mercaptopyruvate sulfurtransferase
VVSTEWLATHLGDPTLRVADVRWYLPTTGKRGRDEYESGHIPGAVFVNLDADLARPAYQGPGRHPLPSADEFAAAMSRLGIGDDSYVVAYDDSGGSVAARLWWLLRHFGHDQVSVLDGGIVQWRAEGRPLETETRQVTTATFTPQPARDDVVGKEIVRQLARDASALVLDARAPERYEGRTEPVDPRPGHIPGARNVPVAGNLTTNEPDGAPRFKRPDELRAQYEALGVPRAQKVIAYCGSGVNACHTLLALHLAGYPDGLLYAGSWSDWSSDPAMEAATGPEP